MLHVRWHLFHEFFYLFILPVTDVIMTLLQYFVCCILAYILIPFSYEDKGLAQQWYDIAYLC